MPSNGSPTVALVTSRAYPALHPDDRPFAHALDGLGIRPVPAVWDDPAHDWASFDALVMRTPWDYYERHAEFRAWLDARIALGVLLCNAADLLAWNYDKRYLLALDAAGVALVPTVFVAQGDDARVAERARAHGWDEIVVKPSVSGGAFRTHRLRVDEADAYAGEWEEILADRGLLIQPFVPDILEGGELSLLFFDGVFSHAVRKRPQAGDYRVQPQHGGTTERAEVDASVVEQARACVAAAPSRPVYARVDGVLSGGRFLLMELEVFEPLLFLSYHPDAPMRFARAVQSRLPPRPAS